MSELISSKDALIALANDKEVEAKHPHDKWFEDWVLLNNIGGKFFLSSMLNDDGFVFRLKPRTITINGIEVPAPFEPKDDEVFYHIFPTLDQGYGWCYGEDESMKQFGAWRTEEEIKQVVAALRQIFE